LMGVRFPPGGQKRRVELTYITIVSIPILKNDTSLT